MTSASMDIPSLQTAHLLLRPWCPEDADVWCNILHEDGVLRYFPVQTPPSLEKAEVYIAHYLGHWSTRGYGHWAIVTPEDGRVVGWNGFEYLPELEETEVAYLLSKRVRGHGYATEAARAAIQFGFETVGLKQIIGLVHPDNIASISVLEKCGLVFADRIALWGMELSRYRIRRSANRPNPPST